MKLLQDSKSESQFQGQLKHTRIRRSQHPSTTREIHVRVWRPKVRMIEEIKSLRSNLQSVGFTKNNVPEKSKVKIDHTIRLKDISSRVPKGVLLRDGKVFLIEPFRYSWGI